MHTFILHCNITSFLRTSSLYYCALLQNSPSKKHVFSMLQPSDTVPKFFCFKFNGNCLYPIVRLSIQKYPAQAYISSAILSHGPHSLFLQFTSQSPLLCTVVIKACAYSELCQSSKFLFHGVCPLFGYCCQIIFSAIETLGGYLESTFYFESYYIVTIQAFTLKM